jgi:HSP20 family protein
MSETKGGMGMSQSLPERRSRLASERWEPLSEFEQMAERMRRLLDQTFTGAAWEAPDKAGGWSPLVDIEEADDAYLVEAELPGMKREDVNIELVGDELSITGEVKEQKRTGAMRRQTRRTGRFAYRVTLPAPVDGENVEAKLNDGVLTVRIPKSEREQRRKIEVKA